MRSKTPYLIIIILLILVIIGLLGWYFLGRPKTPVPMSTTATSTATTTIVAQNAPPIPLHLTASGQYYSADLEYPPTTPLVQSAGAAADAVAVATMESAASSTLATFKKDSDVADITPQAAEDEGLGGENKYELTSTYQLDTSPSTVSYIFSISEDTLGAHPNSYFQTFTFDAKTGANLGLADLFIPGSSYLNTLSTLTRAALTQQQGSQADPTFIDPGTTPEAANFQAFALDADDLVIFFAPYAVAPYSSGPQTVRIPLSQLSSILKPVYQ